MSLAAISSLESARRKFFMNSTYILSRKWESNVFESARGKFFMLEENMCKNRNESNSHKLARIGEKKFFMNSTENMCKNLESNVLGLRSPK